MSIEYFLAWLFFAGVFVFIVIPAISPGGCSYWDEVKGGVADLIILFGLAIFIAAFIWAGDTIASHSLTN